MTSTDFENLVIVGRRAAAFTAAIYAARASLSPLVFEPERTPSYLDGAVAGPMPEFPQAESLVGLMGAMRDQAKRFATRFGSANRLELSAKDERLEVRAANRVFMAKALILAEGAGDLARSCRFLPHSDDGRLQTRGTRCSSRGVFACADIVDGSAQRPVIVAAGTGCQACIDAERWLQAHQLTAPDQHSERW